mmetsp:Transcript_43776/g.52950  ORF Transcript_43776/g.52950 Transcript_43776/m.52950 type:complete len:413 (+) Transcript_43776:167-1405(+)|eukprot:CAMPEP_0197848278 /NCGR_PEP_ID=MMETSP1438-20131217/8128_1 /TAXON_ID=1461541 /ORGANISM="Pterosperma sp., Strain CCMP1384" /LENGTH=412 /DNA_ID=CAMNT_0043460439 /DNA_START=160 /DNA_END=1398 /DNA_ORIENTATION=+
MAHRMLRDPETDGWERSDFPILCESCLGPNPLVRMTKEEYGRECKICTRPFTIFRWRPGSQARYKKTEICQTCSKMKNVCQVCLLDLEYGLPVEVRDKAVGASAEIIPQSDVNKEFYTEQQEKLAKEGLDFESHYGKAAKNSDMISKLRRTAPYYKRNQAHICSFWVRGECTRGAECPYRHEMPTMGPMAEQNLKDRYYGVNDPVANKLLERAKTMPSLSPPEDPTIMTLYVGSLDESITEEDLKDTFYGYGELSSIKIIKDRGCAFVTYTSRSAAEKAANGLCNRLVVKGVRLKLMWGKPARPKPQSDKGAGASSSGGNKGQAPPSMVPPHVAAQMGMHMPMPTPMNYFGLPHPGGMPPPQMAWGPPPGGMPPQMMPPPAVPSRTYYPSMDPQAMGTHQYPSQGGQGGGEQ